MERFFLVDDATGTKIYYGFQDLYAPPRALPSGVGLGLIGVGWLDKVVTWFNQNKSNLTGVWTKYKTKLTSLKNWLLKQQSGICIADCGTYYIVEVKEEGVTYKEIATPGGRQVVSADLVPGWISPCRDMPPDVSQKSGAGGVTATLTNYFPWIAGGLGLLVVFMLLKRR